jgi:hypothetical protein
MWTKILYNYYCRLNNSSQCWKGLIDNPYHVLRPITKLTYHLLWIDVYTCVRFLLLLKSRWKPSPPAPWIYVYVLSLWKCSHHVFSMGKVHGWEHSQNVELVSNFAFPSIKHEGLSIEMVESWHVIGQEVFQLTNEYFMKGNIFKYKEKHDLLELDSP